MSTAEPVSAFGAFKASKQLSEHKKKSKKQQSKAHNGTAPNKQKLNTSAITKADKAAKIFGDNSHAKTKSTTQGKSNKGTQQKHPSAKNAGAKKQSHKFKEHEVVPLVEQLMGDKILSKAQQKKKQELKEYLVDQLERGDRSDSEEGEHDDFDSEASEEAFNEFSDEYTINRSTSYSEDVSGEEEASEEQDSYDQEDSFSAEEEAVPSLNKNKRKLSDATNNKSSTVIKANGIPETKKSKNSDAKVSNKNSAKTITTEAKGRKSVGQEKSSGTRKASITTVSVKLEPLSPPHNITKVNSIEEGKRAFQWLINPVKADEFFGKYWESKACLVKRKQGSYFSHLISCEAIDQMLLKNHVEFTKNLDVTSYKNGIRETLNPEGRAMPPVVWSHYSDGCSIRLLNPQTFLPNLYSLSATLQEFFHCLVGANAYLTPPNSQGFAPHYDDIEAFVLQIEGRKRWKLYKPRVAADVLPRYSSKNFSQAEIGKPILEEVLEPGDVLYFPRGTIHQACTEPGYHSLHITLSVYQKQSYADLFEKMMPLLVQKAIASSVEMRRGLPLHCFQNAGLAFSDNSSKERADLQKKVSQLLHKCVKDMPINDILDAAVDQVAKKFQHEALPPEVLPSEKVRTVFGAHNRIDARGECVYDYEIDERTNVRLLRANILRLVEEEEKLRIYYYLDNSKEYCEYEPNFIEIEALEAASVEVLIKSYPAYVGVSQLPLADDEQKINLVTALWERGLLMMEKPFK